MDCCNYSEYRAPYRDPYARAMPPYYRPHPQHHPHMHPMMQQQPQQQPYGQPPLSTGFSGMYGDMYGHCHSQRMMQHQAPMMPPMDPYRHMDYSHHHQQYHPHAMPHHMHTDYGYGGKEMRLRRGLRDRDRDYDMCNERERDRDMYQGPMDNGWGNCNAMYPVDPEPAPSPWNYYQNSSWSQQAAYPAVAPPRQDPLRGLAAMHPHRPNTPAAPPPMPLPQVNDKVCYNRGRATPRTPQMSNGRGRPKIEEAYNGYKARSPRSPKGYHKREEPEKPCQIEEMPQLPKAEAVPLPAFQQAFGSTEIGRFSEAFVRSEGVNGEGLITEEMVSRAISAGLPDDEWSYRLDASFEARSFSEDSTVLENESNDSLNNHQELPSANQWSTFNTQIKCDDMY